MLLEGMELILKPSDIFDNRDMSSRTYRIQRIDAHSVYFINKKGEELIASRTGLDKSFYLKNSINAEIHRLLEDRNIEIVSFNAVTRDGKVINYQLV